MRGDSAMGPGGTSSGARRRGPRPPLRPSERTSSRSSFKFSSFFRRSSTLKSKRSLA